MRSVALLVLASVLLTLAPGDGARAQVDEAFVPVGVWYPATQPIGRSNSAVTPVPLWTRDLWRRDLAAIRGRGFNSIRTLVDWAASEPQRGTYQFDRLVELLSAADEAGVRVIVQVETRNAPLWLISRYADSVIVPSGRARPEVSSRGEYCLDHPGVRAELAAFIGAASAAAAPSRAFYAIDVWRNPGVSSSTPAEFCYCPYTQARFRDALRRKYQTLAALSTAWNRSFSDWSQVRVPEARSTSADALDWQQFVSLKLQEDLKFRSDASAPRGARPVTSHSDDPPRRGMDAWLMSAAVDHYGASIQETRRTPVRTLASLDALRSAGRGKSWWLGGVSPGTAGDVTTGDGHETQRLWAWAAISRGAGALTFGLLADNSGRSAADPGPSRGGAEMAGVLSRNGSLFAGLRPHPARVAILSNARDTTDAFVNAYEALFDLNIQVDFLHPDELLGGAATRYAVLFAIDSGHDIPAVGAILTAFVNAGGTLILERAAGAGPHTLERTFERGATPWVDGVRTPPVPAGPGASERPVTDPRASTVRVVTLGAGRVLLLPSTGRTPLQMRGARRQLQRVIAGVGVSPEIGVDVQGALVEARFLESADAILLLAMNYGSVPRTVTLTFAPDIPEAIWQNMETGAAVNFRQGPDGATYTRTFPPRDVMVLVRGKRLR